MDILKQKRNMHLLFFVSWFYSSRLFFRLGHDACCWLVIANLCYYFTLSMLYFSFITDDDCVQRAFCGYQQLRTMQFWCAKTIKREKFQLKKKSFFFFCLIWKRSGKLPSLHHQYMYILFLITTCKTETQSTVFHIGGYAIWYCTMT